MPLPTAFIEELKMRNPLEEVVSRYVVLKRAGSNMVGLCPFHSEKSPSFTLYGEHFHCFGCSSGGDVITFIMRIENLEYMDAVRYLADRSGMTLPEQTSFGAPKKAAALTRERAFEMNKFAARHFHENLLSPQGAAGLSYYTEKRRFSRATITHFGLGYAPDSFHGLVDFLTEKGFSVEEIRENSLCGISQKTGKPYDLFRNRVMIPIIDTTGNIVAFGGRVLDDSKPKYLNSSDTVVFKKSKHLFALNFAKNTALGEKKEEYARSGELILCEGYMDVIAMHQAGFTGAVATLGTAITSEHARIVSRYAKTVFLAYDADGAGQNATQKAISLLSDVGVDVKVIKITGAKDPDEYIRTNGAAAFSKLLGASVGQIDYKINRILAAHTLNDPDDKLAAVQEVCRTLCTVSSQVKREIYVERLSKLAGISTDAIRAELNHMAIAENKKIRKKYNDSVERDLLHYRDTVNPDSLKYPAQSDAERRILGMLMLYPEYFDSDTGLTAELFVTSFDRTLYERLAELHKRNGDLAELNETYTPEQVSYIENIRRARAGLNANGLSAFKEQVEALRRFSAKNADADETFEQKIARIKKEKMKNEDKSE